MRVYRCAKCGAGELQPIGDGRKALCPYCQSVMVLPTLDPAAFNRATQLRMNGQYDLAEQAFARIIEESPTDSESYWNMVLCRYGIRYETDRDGSLVPTCNRMSYRLIKDDPDYQKALQYADGSSRELYQREASRIDRILQRIAQISQAQPAYDIFISYKETDGAGYRTPDSSIAQNIYDAIKDKHTDLNVFLARVTLRELAAGIEYEPVIFSAPNTARVMLVVGTSRENLESVWVRNEWSRFRRMMERDNSKKMAVVYRGMDPTRDLPQELGTFSIQAMEAEGFYMQDLLRGVENLLGLRERRRAAAVQANNQVYSSANDMQVMNLIKRANQELDHPDTARKYYQRAIDLKADCAEGWWGLLMLETHNMSDIDENSRFHLSTEAERDWNMVTQYAGQDKRRYYDDQMHDYKVRWTDRYNHKRARQLLDEITSSTSNGKRFDEYRSKYGPEGSVTQECMRIADEEQRQELDEFLDLYEQNHEEFLNLQDWKSTRPIDTCKAEPEYQELDRQYRIACKHVDRSIRTQNGFFIRDIVYMVLVVAAAFLCTRFSPIMRDEYWGLRQQAAPLIVFIATFTVIVRLIQSRKPKSHMITVTDRFTGVLMALVPTLPAYFAYQYLVYRQARTYDDGLKWTCILVGVMIVGYIIMIIGVGMFISEGSWMGGIIFGAIVCGILNVVSDVLEIVFIPNEILMIVEPQINLWLLVIAIIALVITVVMVIANRTAFVGYNGASKIKTELNQEMEQYRKGYIDPVLEYYRQFVDERYLADVQELDEEG